jgi:phage tail-like protein
MASTVKYKVPGPGEMLKYLPAIYSETDGSDDQPLDNFLAAFQKIMLGRADTNDIPAGDKVHHLRGEDVPRKSFEEAIASIADLFDPQKTLDEFLPWLASWAAFSLRADLHQRSQRDFISEIFQLYSRRGTLKNLVRLLSIFTLGTPSVDEDKRRPHFFSVTLSLLEERADVSTQGGDKSKPILDPQEIERQVAIAYALIDLEKPAYTSYELKAIHVSMQIGKRSTIGKDTLLGVIQSKT